MVGSRLYRLASAIRDYEGWFPASDSKNPPYDGSASWRRHNPGNLRSSLFQCGTRNGFSVFYNDELGFLALLYDLYSKCAGKTVTGLSGKSTLAELIHVYAPPTENDSTAYLDFVCNRSGFKSGTLLSEFLLE